MLLTQAPFNSIFPIQTPVLQRIVDRMKKIGFDPAHPILVWKRGSDAVVIDGHTRLQAALSLGIRDIPVIFREFDNPGDALDYAVSQQVERRNMTPADMLRYIEAADKLLERGRKKLAPNGANSEDHPVQHGKSAAKLAEVLNVLNGDKITAVNARDLWKFLESKQEFANWIKDRIRKYGFKEGLDFTVDKIINGENKGRFAANEYFISLDMAKELAMVENNERGRQARQYFIEVEKRFRHAGNLVEAIRVALTPIIRENEQYRARLELARNFLPNGNPGDLNRAGLPKNKFRRGCYVARNGRDISLLMENPTLPGLFEEIPVNLMNGHFGALPEPEAVYED